MFCNFALFEVEQILIFVMIFLKYKSNFHFKPLSYLLSYIITIIIIVVVTVISISFGIMIIYFFCQVT